MTPRSIPSSDAVSSPRRTLDSSATSTRANRASLPSYGQMLKDHTGLPASADELQRSVEDGYANRLY